jgi:hypothetical protein
MIPSFSVSISVTLNSPCDAPGKCLHPLIEENGTLINVRQLLASLDAGRLRQLIAWLRAI